MRVFRIIEKEDNPTIQLNKVDLNDGFIIVISGSEAVGIIVYDDEQEEFLFIDNFKNSFISGISPSYRCDKLEDLMKGIKNDFISPIEFNFIRIEQ